MPGMSSGADAARMALYRAGKRDFEIAAIEGVNRSAVYQWRRYRKLPAYATTVRIDEAGQEQRAECHAAGLSDAQAATALGTTVNAVRKWRKRTGLAANRPVVEQARPARLSAAQEADRVRLHRSRHSDAAIAAKVGVDRTSITEWRWRRNLPANEGGITLVDSGPRTAPYMVPGIILAARAAVGTGLAPDIRDEAAAELLLALTERGWGVDRAGELAAKARSRTVRRFASRFGPRSLDEDLTGDGFTLMDTIADPAASSWLEEMGATAW